MYADLPPPLPDGSFPGWRGALLAHAPVLKPALLRLAVLSRALRLSLRHLAEQARELRSDGAAGLAFWRAHQAQEALRLARLAALRARLPAPDFALREVTAAFDGLVLKSEDGARAQWFADAQDKLEAALARLETASVSDPELLKDALQELRFLGEMPEFYARFRIGTLEHQVKTMHEALLARLDTLTRLKREQLEAAKVQQAIDATRAEEARLRAEQARLAEEAGKVRELKDKLALEQQRSLERKALLEAEEKMARADEELARARAERERQAQLQQDYLRMQQEERLKQALGQARTLEAQLDTVSQALSLGRYNPADPIIRARLETLRQALEAREIMTPPG